MSNNQNSTATLALPKPSMEQSFKRKRGGARQRLQASSAATPPTIESGLAKFLLKEYAWGSMSPQLVQKIASLAMADVKQAAETGGLLKDLDSLSKLGGDSSLSNNMHRDILKFQAVSKLPSGFEMEMVFKGKGMQVQKILLPHELFACIYHSYPDAWAKIMLPSKDKLAEFWLAQQNHPNMEGNPMKSKTGLNSMCIPLGLHGDEVPITGKGKCWCKSMLTFEWCSLLGVGVTCERMLWVWGAFNKMIEVGEEGTLVYFWKVLAWSFFWLQQGVWPKTDVNGESYHPDTIQGKKAGMPLADGYCATIWSVMGDLDYLAKTLQLPRSTSANPCCLCRCTLHGPETWKTNTADALWKNTLWKPLEWTCWEGRSKCKLFSIPGVSSVSVALDWMHNKYLGIDQYIFGSVLYILCFMVLPLQPLQNLSTCWCHIKQYYKDHNTANRYQNIEKLSMFLRKKGVVKLRGKAGELRGIGPAILDLWTAHMNDSLNIHTKIKLLLKLNCRVEGLLAFHSDSVCLPAADAQKCIEYAFTMTELQLEIHEYFKAEDACKQQLFNVTGKNHMILHSVLLSPQIHPWMVWCFMGEDFMRKIQKIGEACVKGLQATAVSTKMVAHYRLGLHMQLSSIS